MRSFILATALTLASMAAHAQDAAPRQYKLQQPGLVEQMRQMIPIENQKPANVALPSTVAEQVMQCWNAPAGATEKGIVVVLQITYNADGTPNTVAVAEDKARLMEDNDFRLAVKSAMDAVQRCPLKHMTGIPYEQWRQFEIEFNPTISPAS